MKRLLFSLLSVIGMVLPGFATTYYVAPSTLSDGTTFVAGSGISPSGTVAWNHGVDTNNGTAVTTPYASFYKAESVMASGDVCIAAPGTYTENKNGASTRWFLNKGFTSFTKFTSFTQVASDVVIQPSSSSGGGCITWNQANPAAYYWFDHLTFASAGANATLSGVCSSGNYFSASQHDLKWSYCRFVTTRLSFGAYALLMQSGTGMSGVTLDNCTSVETGAGSADTVFIRVDGNSQPTGTPFSNLTVTNCTVQNVGGWGSIVRYLSGVTVRGNDLSCTATSAGSTYGFSLGNDGQPTTGESVQNATVEGNRVKSLYGHAFLLGGGCDSTDLAQYNDIYAGGYNTGGFGQGVVIKDCTGITFRRNRVQTNTAVSGTAGALNLKGCTGCTVDDNQFLVFSYGSTQRTWAVREFADYQATPSQLPFGGNFVTNNRFHLYGDAWLYNLAQPADMSAKSTYSGNVVEFHDSSVVGALRTGASASLASNSANVNSASLTAARARWAAGGYAGESTNDATTVLGSASFWWPYGHSATGAALYAVITSSNGQVWNGASFEDYNPTQPWRYRHWMIEDQSESNGVVTGSYRYRRWIPKALPTGDYTIAYYSQAGSLASPSDTLLATRTVAVAAGRPVGLVDAARKTGG